MISSLLLAAVLLLPQPARAPSDTLVVGILGAPVSLEPHRATDIAGVEIIANVCETLVRVRPGSLRPEGLLATTWATLDQRTWTFTLREGVRFHDGTPFDADVVVGNVEHFIRERAFAGRAERIGPHVVQITLERPNAALLSTLSQPFFSIQSARHLRHAEELAVGTGPFRLVRAGRDEVELEANTGYWGGRPRLQRLVFRRLPSSAALVDGLLSGDIDVSTAVDQGRVAELRDQPDVTLDSQTGLNVCYLSLNNERPPFQDDRVRRALARAVDRNRIVEEILYGHGLPADTPLPPSLLGRDARTRELVLDWDRARELLARAGLADGFEATLAVSAVPRAYLPDPRRLAELVRDDLGQVGISVRIREVDTLTEHVRLTSRGDYGMALLGWQADTLDPNDFLTVLLDSEAIGTTNRSRYRSDRMDRLLKRARMESAPRSRLALYRQAQDLFLEDMPFVPLYHASVFTARRRDVNGLVVGPTGLLRYNKVWKSE
jgi:peptide/nickel transport system substrate-binding protein